MIADVHFWPPSVTSQFAICPVPFHLDPYNGCVHNCAYCFGRDLTNFQRRTGEEVSTDNLLGGKLVNLQRNVEAQPRFTDLTVNDAKKFSRWMKKQESKEHDPTDAVSVALKMRMPLKIGAIGDPCPPHERDLHVTENVLRVLADRDYPVEIQTKNPVVLAEVLERLGPGENIVAAVTLVTLDEEWIKRVEPGAPSAAARLVAVKRIVEMGYPAMIKVQPAVYPRILKDLPRLAAAVKKSGAFAFQTEGLKVRIAMPQDERRIFDAALGNVRKEYGLRYGEKESSDYVLKDRYKLEYIELAELLAKRHGLRYFSSDNSPMGRGDSPECCGTEILRGYNVSTYNLRHEAFGLMKKDDPFAEVLVDFTKSTRSAKGAKLRTVRSIIDDAVEEKNARKRSLL